MRVIRLGWLGERELGSLGSAGVRREPAMRSCPWEFTKEAGKFYSKATATFDLSPAQYRLSPGLCRKAKCYLWFVK